MPTKNVTKRALSIPEKTLRYISTSVGVLICAMLAVATVMIFSPRTCTPILFIGVVFAVAYMFGSAAGMLGALVSAMVFAYFFSPAGSLHIVSAPARTNLGWLLLLGIPASYLLIPHKDGFFISRRRWFRGNDTERHGI